MSKLFVICRLRVLGVVCRANLRATDVRRLYATVSPIVSAVGLRNSVKTGLAGGSLIYQGQLVLESTCAEASSLTVEVGKHFVCGARCSIALHLQIDHCCWFPCMLSPCRSVLAA